MVANPLTVLTLSDLRERTSAKWRQYDPDVLPLFVAEMDVPLADPVREALERAIRIGDSGYPGSTPYRESFVDFAQARWAWPTLDVRHVTPVLNVIQGYVDTLTLATDPGSDIVVTSPVYPPFYSYVREAGRSIREARLGPDMRIDLAALEHAFAEATAGGRSAAFLLCNPHNPGGVVHTRSELEAVAALSQRYGVPVVSDEIHAPIVYTGHTFIPYLTVDSTALALHSASKAWNLAGSPAALLVAGEHADAPLARYRAGKHHHPSHLGVIAQTAAYQNGGEWFDALMIGLEYNRLLVRDLVADQLPGVTYLVPEGTFLTWLDFRGTGLGDDPASVLLERGRVALNSGPTFGAGGEGHARLNIATSPQILAEAVQRIAAALR